MTAGSADRDQLPAARQGSARPICRSQCARARGSTPAPVTLTADDPVPLLRELTNWAADRGVGLPGLTVGAPSLEDVYLELTEDADGAEARGMSGVAVVLHQFRFDQKVFWRNPAAVFFTALLPLLFLFLLATIFKNTHISGVDVKGATYYVPAILTLAVVSATTVKLATNLPTEREAGQLKRVRGHAAAARPPSSPAGSATRWSSR